MAGMPSAAAAATTALNSYGSAMRENETWQRSLEGRMAAFQTQFEITASSMINSRWVKWFYNSGTAIILNSLLFRHQLSKKPYNMGFYLVPNFHFAHYEKS